MRGRGTLGEVRGWAPDQVVTFLTAAVPGFTEEEARILHREKVNGDALLRITREELRQYGLAGGPAIGVVEAVDHLKVIIAQSEPQQQYHQPQPQPAPVSMPVQAPPPAPMPAPVQMPAPAVVNVQSNRSMGDEQLRAENAHLRDELQKSQDEVRRQRVLLLGSDYLQSFVPLSPLCPTIDSVFSRSND